MANFLWDSIKSVADKVGEATAQASYKTKVNAELLLIDRELKGRQQTFGVELYQYVEQMSKEPAFYASDDLLTTTLRAPLLKAQREIAALNNKKVKQKTNLETAKAQRAAIAAGTTWQEKVVSTAKTTAMVGGEVKLHTELTLMENEMTYYKYLFGEELYVEFQRLEDEKGWLPTDREIRSIYDQCRSDIEKIRKRRVAKEEELSTLGGAGAATSGAAATSFQPPPATLTTTPYPNPSIAQPYAAETPVSVPPSFHDSSPSGTPSIQIIPAAAATPAVSSFGALPAPAPASVSSGLFGAPPASSSYGAATAPELSYGAFSSQSPPAQGYSSTGFSKPMGYSAPRVAQAPPHVAAAPTNNNWMNQADPFAPMSSQAMNNNTLQSPPPQQQQSSSLPYDPFALAPQPTLQQHPQQQPNFFSPDTPSAGKQPSMYDDPFAGLSNFQ